jgi:hypothetical protein
MSTMGRRTAQCFRLDSLHRLCLEWQRSHIASDRPGGATMMLSDWVSGQVFPRPR